MNYHLVLKDFERIIDHAYFRNWAPDWEMAKNVYTKFPDSYSILTSFAYYYFEELMRSTTSEYEMPFLNKDGENNKFKVGMGLIRLAKDENAEKPEYIKLLDSTKKYYQYVCEILMRKMEEIKLSMGIFTRAFEQRKHLNSLFMTFLKCQNILVFNHCRLYYNIRKISDK